MERVVLFRIEHFQQRGRRVAVEVCLRHLVDFIENEHRIRAFGLYEALDYSSRHSTDVCLSVSADFCFVMQSSERYSDVLSLHGACDALSKRCLSDSWRAVKAYYRTLEVTSHLEHSEMFEYAFLHFLHSVVVLVEHLFGIGQVEVVACILVPRKIEHCVEIVVLHVEVRTLRVHVLQLAQFLCEYFTNFFAPFLFLAACNEFFNLIVAVVSELFLYVAEFLLQEVVALLLVELFACAHLDVGLQHGELEFSVENSQKLVCSCRNEVLVEQ